MKKSEIDALFALPLADFTAARNALATRLKKEGQTVEGERVKAMTKPPATAWAVNQLYWRHRKDVDRLLAISDKARKAQAARRPDLRSLLDQRRRTISDLANRAADILVESGHAPSVDARRKIVTTLESLAAWGESNSEVQAGRLTSDLEPLGFDGLAALLGGEAFKPAKVLPFRSEEKSLGAGASRSRVKEQSAEEKAEKRARAKKALKAAEKKLTAARRDAQRAETAAAKAAEQAEALEQQKRELDARYRKAEQTARSARDDAAKSARAVEAAERAADIARKALE